MTSFDSNDELISFAIEMEEQMKSAYENFAKMPKCSSFSSMLIRFTEEALVHHSRLSNIKLSGQLNLNALQLVQISQVGYQIRRDCNTLKNCKDILLAVMDNEKMAFKLYSQIAALCEDQLLKLLFETLATDQSRHKLYFELEFDKQ